MGTLSNDELDAKITDIETALETVRESHLAALTGDMKSFKLDSAGGSQQTTRRSLKEFRTEIRALENELELYKRRRSGRGNPGINLRRRW